MCQAAAGGAHAHGRQVGPELGGLAAEGAHGQQRALLDVRLVDAREVPVAPRRVQAPAAAAARLGLPLPVLVLVLVLLPFPLVQVAVEEHVDVHLVRVIPVLHGPVEVHVGGGHVGLRAHEVAHDERVREPWNLKKLMKPVLELQPNCFKVLI